jgi:TPR repeat protein
MCSFSVALLWLMPAMAWAAPVCAAGMAGRLRPDDVSDLGLYSDWSSNTTVTLTTGARVRVAEGEIAHRGVEGSSRFALLPQIVTRAEVAAILALANDSALEFDDDPDTVDGMSTHEMFHFNHELHRGDGGGESMKLDSTPGGMEARRSVREKLDHIMRPILDERITPLVRERYPELCGKIGGTSNPRACTPCYSLIRRYRPDERRSHATHRDGHAIVTVVVSLSDFNREYRGGVYVATSRSDKRVVGLSRGDAVVHRSDLLHGVKVKDDGGVRWSWILWFRDSATCEDHSSDWFLACAEKGGAVCQAQHANHGGVTADVLHWNGLAAEQGLGESMVKMARAHLKLLPTDLPSDPVEAARLYRAAIASSEEPDAQYGLAQLLLEGRAEAAAAANSGSATIREMLSEVVALLEAAAATGHAYAQFNLGIAHLYGYADSGGSKGSRDVELAGQWFEACGLPEGFVAAGMYYGSAGLTEQAARMNERAARLGFGSAWRQRARMHTGSGGAGGVDLNMPWPALPNGQRPPKW